MSFALKFNFAKVARDSGFHLRSYSDGHLDWRLVGSVEIERLLREQNLEQIDSVLDHLAEVPLGTLLETNILDTGIAKYFLLSQFAIQYLLFCRKFLEETVDDLKEAHGSAQMEIATIKRSLSEANSEILQLHKKVTQMEAIHEVIYPCHLCTKNFVSNDALNLHISRKHSADNIKTEIMRSETPATASKERENDLNLINAIKLELEVKHLKERLNIAERKIKENGNNVPPSKEKTCACDKRDSPITHSVGIQSNLCEIKENDDITDSNSNLPHVSLEQLNVLQEHLQELNQWKLEQQTENRQFFNDIESKFKMLSKALENTQNSQKSNVDKMDPLTSNTLKELEVFLNEKVEAIAETNGLKIDEVINKMETNYETKLEKLEKQLDKLTRQTENLKFTQRHIEPTAESFSIEDASKVILVKNVTKPNSETILSETAQKNNSAQTEKVRSEKSKDQEHVSSEVESSEESIPPSNKTFVISSTSINELNTDNTEMSERIENEVEVNDFERRQLKHSKKPDKVKIPSRRPQQRPVTKKMVSNLTESRLLSLGIDKKTKSLSQTSMQHVTEELRKRRNILKIKHPSFYANRNKIKKFVDKICSSKMPEKAGKLLWATNEPKIPSKPDNDEDSQDCLSSDEESNIFTQPTNNSTPVKASKTADDDFKQRLENILASPIKKPVDYSYANNKDHLRTLANKPVPLPRKRVMFTQDDR